MRLTLLSWSASVLLLSGCLLKHRVEEPDLQVEIPNSWSTEFETTSPLLDDTWCPGLQDPDLDAWISAADRQNLGLAAGWARVKQAEALTRQAQSSRWPTLDATIGASRARTPGGPPSGVQTNTSLNASLAASYEIDVWGKVEAGLDAAELDATASVEDVRALAVTVRGQLVDSWLDAASAGEKLGLLDAQIAVQRQYLELVDARFDVGLSAGLDLVQQEQQLSSLEGQRPALEAARVIAANRIAVLTGAVPGAEFAQALVRLRTIPDFDAPPSLGLPADVIHDRPDVRAAWARAQAADQRVTVALASRLPSIRLTGSLSLLGKSPAAMIEHLFWSVGSSLVAPLVDGGRRAAEQHRAQAAEDERIALLAQSILTAFEEVENALIRELSQREVLAQLQTQRALAASALDLARDQYLAGNIDYLRVLTALQSVQRIESSIVDTRRQIAAGRVQLCRATGGGWTSDLAARSNQETAEDQ